MNLNQGLIMYGTATCPACKQADTWLQSQGVPYRKVDITGQPASVTQELTAITQQQTIPQFFIDGCYIQGGFGAVKQIAGQIS